MIAQKKRARNIYELFQTFYFQTEKNNPIDVGNTESKLVWLQYPVLATYTMHQISTTVLKGIAIQSNGPVSYTPVGNFGTSGFTKN